ncbi:LOW QUALITY PROTEIN: hypothetical protein HJC23_006029, partial [Cyclotella cryptica]
TVILIGLRKSKKFLGGTSCHSLLSFMAARCWIPTKFRVINKLRGTPKEFGICWGSREEVRAEQDKVLSALKNVKLDANIKPLMSQIREIKSLLSGQAHKLRQNDEFVAVIICTNGVPTDENDFVESLMSLDQLPVRIISRLVTNNDDVVNFFASLDIKIECDVLGDYWGEGMEVYLRNSWLTYGIGIH